MAERKSTYRSIEIVRKTSDNEQAQSGVEVLAENIMHDNWDGFGLRLIIEHEFELYIMVVVKATVPGVMSKRDTVKAFGTV